MARLTRYSNAMYEVISTTQNTHSQGFFNVGEVRRQPSKLETSPAARYLETQR